MKAFYLLTAGLFLAAISCERHEWEDTKVLHEVHGDHGGHGEHGEDHDDAHGEDGNAHGHEHDGADKDDHAGHDH